MIFIYLRTKRVTYKKIFFVCSSPAYRQAGSEQTKGIIPRGSAAFLPDPPKADRGPRLCPGVNTLYILNQSTSGSAKLSRAQLDQL